VINKEYEPIIEQLEEAGTNGAKLDCIGTILKMVCMNHLPTIEGRIEDGAKKRAKFERMVYIVLTAILLAVFGTNQEALNFILDMLGRIF